LETEVAIASMPQPCHIVELGQHACWCREVQANRV
jgi:hypothetical protein